MNNALRIAVRKIHIEMRNTVVSNGVLAFLTVLFSGLVTYDIFCIFAEKSSLCSVQDVNQTKLKVV